MKLINILEDIRFMNVGEAPPNPGPEWTYSRQWNACIEYGFMSAGQGLVYSQPLLNIKVKDVIAAYITGCGYVGSWHCDRESHKKLKTLNLKVGGCKILKSMKK